MFVNTGPIYKGPGRISVPKSVFCFWFTIGSNPAIGLNAGYSLLAISFMFFIDIFYIYYYILDCTISLLN